AVERDAVPGQLAVRCKEVPAPVHVLGVDADVVAGVLAGVALAAAGSAAMLRSRRQRRRAFSRQTPAWTHSILLRKQTLARHSGRRMQLERLFSIEVGAAPQRFTRA